MDDTRTIEQQHYYPLLAQHLIKEFEKRNFAALYCEDRAAALRAIIEAIPSHAVVSCGGSQTLREIGVREALKAGGYDFLDPDDGVGAAAKDEIAHRALAADYYLTSTNAIAVTGELVNLDGYGNRVGALIFGPKHVIVVAGLNKVAPSLEAAIARAKGYAAHMTSLLFKRDYASFEELAGFAEVAYSQLVVTPRSMTKGRILIVLVGETLGF